MFDKLLITEKEELIKHKGEISRLFKSSFESDLDINLWDWAYIDNPCGSPIVSLYYHEKKLVGHYAIIPMRLRYKEQELLTGLSMTTMVDISYRRQGLFIKQANEVYEKAMELGFALVYGFPNKNSAPGFKKRLDWVVDTNGCVVKAMAKDISLKKQIRDDLIYFDSNDGELLRWRLSKPGENYVVNDGIILKEFEDCFDIVKHKSDFSVLEEQVFYNVYLDSCDEYDESKLFDYSFGYRIFDQNLTGAKFKVDLIMSDVF